MVQQFGKRGPLQRQDAKFGKQLLLSDEVLVNDEPEGRRGRKLHEGDVIEVTGQEQMRIVTADAPEG